MTGAINPIRRHHIHRIEGKYSEQIKDSFHRGWHNIRGQGRWWKRCLSKARRRDARLKLRGHKGQPTAHWESTVNYRAD